MKKIVAVVTSALLALVIWRILAPNNSTQPMQSVSEPKAVIDVQIQQPDVASINKEPATSAVEMSPFQLTSTQKAAKVIASNYRETLRYAPYSQPLSIHDIDRLEPNRFVPVTVPNSDLSGTIALALNKYRFTYPEPIELQLTGEGISRAKVIVSLVDEKNKILFEKGLSVSQGQANTKLPAKEAFNGDIQLKVIADVGGDPITIVAQAKYVQPSAKLVGLKYMDVQGSDLIIALELEVEDAGIYRVRANLFDGGTPLAHLVTKSKLANGKQEIALKAHQSVLPDLSNDLKLMTFIVERMSSVPGERTRYGESLITEISLHAADLSDLKREPYKPSDKERASLQFLEGMAQQTPL
ncbi:MULTISPECIES: hypothetical protein [Pseudoalteromonas]|uniref:Uncharacterized protein n=1 Tax=Pseudoalteromonas luteoviolacea (strain 2ta16) TaxID=1353533 RepID=V4J7A6_PSEL2|nr:MULTISPECIES: hypothetical protein [Pseudoalteromonas]ESP91172.1 hypothetical protein PL2TA16_01179 [Pseudoalteromonas luteoviolacea 2ta16]KZN41295.1 hypothetical protein N483_15480 [Pseudoalteromonas luteoviolacea NCIMB 1944]MCG7550226.1 hypothetical protein [Pseudoalteromonas sp. Of7M-16]